MFGQQSYRYLFSDVFVAVCGFVWVPDPASPYSTSPAGPNQGEPDPRRCPQARLVPDSKPTVLAMSYLLRAVQRQGLDQPCFRGGAAVRRAALGRCCCSATRPVPRTASMKRLEPSAFAAMAETSTAATAGATFQRSSRAVRRGDGSEVFDEDYVVHMRHLVRPTGE